jgi:Peptidase M66
VLNILRLTIGIGLLMSLVTACQSGQKQIQKFPDPSFNLSLDSSSVNLTQGDIADLTVNLERLDGFEDAVAVSLKDLPADVTVSPAVLTIPATTSSLTVHLSASGTASIATGKVTVEAVSGALQESVSLNLATIKPDPSRPDVFIKRTEWGQSVIKSDLRLVPGKSALLLAQVNATQAGISGIRVRATASANGTTLGTLDLTAPTKIPTTDTTTNLTSTYWSVLPKDWIRPGLEVKLEVDAGRNLKESNEANNSQVLKPSVGTGNKLYLTMVPIIVGGKPAMTLTAAAVAEIRTGMMALWPLVDVDIKMRAPYTVKTDVMNELTALRDADNSKRYYYGFYDFGGGYTWVSHPVAAGYPNLRVIAHELGHDFGQLHAPCGKPDQIDVNYPYKTGSIGSWGFDPDKKTLIDPSAYNDVMGYCNTFWTSDYMYGEAQLFLEKNPSTDPAKTAATTGVTTGATTASVLLVSGTLEDGQMNLEPMQRITGLASAPTSGPYRLRLETASGPQEVSFDLRRATHEDGTGRVIDKAQFSFTMPDPGSISKVTITENNVVKLERSTAGMLSTQSVQATNVQPITVQRNGSSVTVTWDAKAYSSVAVAHIASDGIRTTLALGLTGGTAVLELGALGIGQFEVSASDGLNGIKQRF